MQAIEDNVESQDTIAEPSQAGFTQLSLPVLQKIRSSGGSYRDMAAYMVVCSGINARDGMLYSTHGAKSVSQRTGMGYRIAENALTWLCEQGFLQAPDPNEKLFLGKGKSLVTQVRWMLNLTPSDFDVAVSNQAVQGIGGDVSSPLKRLLADVDGTQEIGREQAVADALILWLQLMRDQDFDAYAGVSPQRHHVLYEPATSNGRDEYLYLDDGHVCEVSDTNGVLVTVQQAKVQTTNWRYIREMAAIDEEVELTDDEQQEIRDRYWHAMGQLRRLSFVYGASVLWRGNPLDARKGRQAEPIATIHIDDSRGRKSDAFALPDINRLVWRKHAVPIECEFDPEGQLLFHTDNYMRYVVAKTQLQHTILLKQLRVRYWAANEATVTAREIERKRTQQMIANLSSL